jgi:hypothetical protein
MLCLKITLNSFFASSCMESSFDFYYTLSRRIWRITVNWIRSQPLYPLRNGFTLFTSYPVADRGKI